MWAWFRYLSFSKYEVFTFKFVHFFLLDFHCIWKVGKQKEIFCPLIHSTKTQNSRALIRPKPKAQNSTPASQMHGRDTGHHLLLSREHISTKSELRPEKGVKPKHCVEALGVTNGLLTTYPSALVMLFMKSAYHPVCKQTQPKYPHLQQNMSGHIWELSKITRIKSWKVVRFSNVLPVTQQSMTQWSTWLKVTQELELEEMPWGW